MRLGAAILPKGGYPDDTTSVWNILADFCLVLANCPEMRLHAGGDFSQKKLPNGSSWEYKSAKEIVSVTSSNKLTILVIRFLLNSAFYQSSGLPSKFKDCCRNVIGLQI